MLLESESKYGALARSCSAIVGMHPDEATEAIVDVALACGKPFAVVPCCVFTRLFPDRRMPHDKASPVTTREEFAAYLAHKAGAHISRLPFVGANLVVYSHGTPCTTPR